MRINLDRSFYTSTYRLKEKHGEIEIYTDSHNCVITYTGKRQKKPFTNCRFRSEADRDKYIKNFISVQLRRIEEKKRLAEKKKEALKSFRQPYKIGDIFTSSWGYDQTNVNFYQIVETKNKSVTVREIAKKRVGESGCSMSDYVMPDIDCFISDETMNKRVNPDGGCIKIDSCEYAFPFDGKPKYRSWYA